MPLLRRIRQLKQVYDRVLCRHTWHYGYEYDREDVPRELKRVCRGCGREEVLGERWDRKA